MEKNTDMVTNPEYVKSNGHSYMLWKRREIYDKYDIHMVQENNIKGLLPMEVIAAQGFEQYWYDISGYRAFDDYSSGRIVKLADIKNILINLKEVLQKCERYMLDENSISLAPSEIYISSSDQRTAFCYKPFWDGDFSEGMNAFFEYFLTMMDHSDSEEVRKCYEVYERSRRENLYIGDLIDILESDSTEAGIDANREEEKEPDADRQIYVYSSEDNGITNNALINKIKDYGKRLFKKKQDKEKRKRYTLDIEPLYVAEPTKEVYEGEKTVLLGAGCPEIVGRLIYRGYDDESSFVIDKDDFILGSSGLADGILLNSAVSRKHATIKRKEGEYILADLNSKNGTSVNGKEVNYKEEVILSKNDTIKFADCEYLFI
ncbi:MAG: FHA domain-containing protein [Lachnospiraceae bacterium]|nr:FHA domain-containing protein [Lachnospiraceae bacterium]